MFVLHVTALLPLDVIEDNDDIKYYGKKNYQFTTPFKF